MYPPVFSRILFQKSNRIPIEKNGGVLDLAIDYVFGRRKERVFL